MSDLIFPYAPNYGGPALKFADQGGGTYALPVTVVSGGGGGGAGYSITDLIVQDFTNAQGIRREKIDSAGTITFAYENFDGTAWVPTPPMVAVAISPSAGTATSAKQDTGNTSLASLDTKTPTVGQKTKAGSHPVVLASDQDAITVTGSVSTTAPVDSKANGSITILNSNGVSGAGTAGSFVALTGLNGNSLVSVQVTGTWTGTLQAQCNVNGTDWIPISLAVMTTATPGNTVVSISSASTGIWLCPVPAFAQFRIVATAAVTGTATVYLEASPGSAGALTLTQPVNLTQFGGSSAAVVAGSSGSSSRVLTVAIGGSATNPDYAAQAWAATSGNGATITDADGMGNVCSFDVNLTAFTAGSSTGLDIFLQTSPDGGTTWYDIWQCEALTATGHVYIPALHIPGRRRMRWVNRGGAATTATVTVTATRMSVTPGSVIRQWFDRTTAVLQGTPVGSATASYDMAGCRNLVALVTLSAIVTTGAAYQLQVSADNTNWGYVGSPVTATVGTTTISAVNIAGRYARLVVQAAETGGAQTGSVIAIMGS